MVELEEDQIFRVELCEEVVQVLPHLMCGSGIGEKPRLIPIQNGDGEG
jgi:hypothetical protein